MIIDCFTFVNTSKKKKTLKIISRDFKFFFFWFITIQLLNFIIFPFFTIAKHLFFIDIFKQSATFLTPLLSKDNNEFFITQKNSLNLVVPTRVD